MSRTQAQPDGLRRHVTLYDVVMFQAEFGVEALGRCRLFTGLGEGPLQSLARNLRLRRFKGYGVYYLIMGNEVWVLAVLHGAREVEKLVLGRKTNG